MHVLGRSDDADAIGGSRADGAEPAPRGDRDPPTARLGAYRARDGSRGAGVALDLDRPHACLVVGKRGSGKSHTLGVLAEGAVRATGVAPVVLDPMGDLTGLAESGSAVHERPTIRADALPPTAWPRLLGLDPTGAAGTLVWQAAADNATLAGMRDHAADADATESARRGAENHLRLAASWEVFDSAGLAPDDLLRPRGTVLDLSGLAPAPTNAVVRAVSRGVYDEQVARDSAEVGRVREPERCDGPLPWLLLDEAHAFFDGIAAPALQTLLTRGRAPGVSLVAATQRPDALPDVATSQADLLVAHRLTTESDVASLAAATPAYLRGTLRDRLPSERGCAVVVDDATESIREVRIRDRRTPRGGASPRASAATDSSGATGSAPNRSPDGTETSE